MFCIAEKKKKYSINVLFYDLTFTKEEICGLFTHQWVQYISMLERKTFNVWKTCKLLTAAASWI